MGILSTISEGGQTWAHRVRMLRQVVKVGLLCGVLTGALFFGIKVYRLPSTRFQALWTHMSIASSDKNAKTLSVDAKFWSKLSKQRYTGANTGGEITVSKATLKRLCDKETDLLNLELKQYAFQSLILIIGVFSLFMVFFLLRGLQSKRKKHVSGTKLASPRSISLDLKLSKKASFLKVGPLSTIKGAETQHFLVSGGTGSGKTSLFHHMLPQIRSQGQRAVIVDTTGDFVGKYYRPGKDILLNPFDERSKLWSPWVECRDEFDFDSIAESFIPESYCEKENYWRTAARSLFSSALKLQKDDPDIESLVQLLLYAPLDILCTAMAGTEAAAHVDINSEKTAASIRSVAASNLMSLKHLKPTDDPFSLRSWVENPTGDSWVFLNVLPAQRSTLIPLVSTWFSVAMRSLLQMPIDIHRRLWFVADELPTLSKLKDLQMCLTEGRKYGACALLAIQSPAQLEMIYGHDATRVILGNCNTKIAFREQDYPIAQLISKMFGEKETKEYKEGISYGANTIRDGVSLSPVSKKQPVVSVTDLQSLNELEAFVNLPGRVPISKVKLKRLV